MNINIKRRWSAFLDQMYLKLTERQRLREENASLRNALEIEELRSIKLRKELDEWKITVSVSFMPQAYDRDAQITFKVSRHNELVKFEQHFSIRHMGRADVEHIVRNCARQAVAILHGDRLTADVLRQLLVKKRKRK